MAGTAFAKNSAWSMLSLLNIWGPDVTPEQEKKLADMVVNRFNEIAQAHGSTVTVLVQRKMEIRLFRIGH